MQEVVVGVDRLQGTACIYMLLREMADNGFLILEYRVPEEEK